MTHARGRPCRVCGGDEWYESTRVCAPCQRRRTRSRNKVVRRDPVYRMLQQAKDRARKAGLACTITEDDIRTVMGERCPVFGTAWGKGPQAPSLDRLVPTSGYVPGNIAVLSMKANLIKSNAQSEAVLAVGNWMRRQGL